MTVKKFNLGFITAVCLLAMFVSPAMGAFDDEDTKIKENTSDLGITPTLEDGKNVYDEFSFSDESYDLLSLINYLFYFLASAGTIYIGILALIDILKGKNDVKSVYNDIKGRKSVQGIIVTVLSVKIVYVLIDFLFKMNL